MKYQIFLPKNLVARQTQKAAYQKHTTGKSESQLAMLKKRNLSFSAFMKLKKHCDCIGIGFVSSPVDLPIIHFLTGLQMPL